MIDPQKLPSDAVYNEINSPLGRLSIVANAQGLHAITWGTIKHLKKDSQQKIILETKKQLQEYFSGKRKIFNLPLVLTGTNFQKQAWQQLLKIPYAKTLSYGEQAEKIGDKNKARAVGMANGKNPIPIIVPCHRVIGANGKLAGFTGGLDKKIFLLELEKRF